MKTLLRRFFLSILICIPLSLHGSQEALRTALVMGNWKYQKMNQLSNTDNDAEDMVVALRAAGFQVVFVLNGGIREMNAKIQEFGNLLKTRQGVGLIYYSGHGIQAEGVNYLVPVDAEAATQDSVKYETIPVDQVLSQLTKANNNFNIIILDACRYDPYSKGMEAVETPGLAKMNAPKGSIIAFATDPGNTSSTGTGRNSLYTKYLLQAIKTPGLSVEEVFKKTLQGVSEESNGKQIPWMSTSFVGDFYFLGAPPPHTDVPADELIWNFISASSNVSDFDQFLKTYPNSSHGGDARAKLAVLKESNPKPVKIVTAQDLYKQASALYKTDKKGAAALYLQSAQGGYAPAQAKVGIFFELGIGFGQNYQEALKWYKIAADQGDQDGLYLFGNMYDKGKGVPKDPAAAVAFYQKAADKGGPDGQEALGDHYLSGMGVERDLVLSTKYYKLAAEQGLEDSQYQLALAYLNGTGVDVDQQQALYWYKLSARQGNVKAQEGLAECAHHGIGMDPDPVEAIKWYQKVIDQGESSSYKFALNNLGTIYMVGAPGVPMDIQKALDLLKKAGEAGMPSAWFNLGLIYEIGTDSASVDMDKAFIYYKKAAELGHKKAAHKVSAFYKNGQGVPVDPAQADYWAKKAEQ